MSERLNIKNLLVEPEKKPERLFDPEREFTSQDWQEIDDYLRTSLQESASSTGRCNILRYAADIKLLGHAPHIEEAFWQTAVEDVDQLTDDAGQNGDWRTLASYTRALRLLGMKITLNTAQSEGIAENFQGYQDTLDIDSYLDLAITLKVLGEGVALSPAGEQELHHNLAYHREQKDGWIPEIAAAHRLLVGDPKLTQEEWNQMKEEFRAMDDPYFKLKQAGHMAILAADELNIPPGGGLELVWKKDTHKPETPALPEQRRF